MDYLEFDIPTCEVGRVLGKRGFTCKELVALTKCTIKVDNHNHDKQRPSTVVVTGARAAEAKEMIERFVVYTPCTELGVKLLYVDLLTFSYKFFDKNKFSVQPAEKHLIEMVMAARVSNVKLVGFFPGVRKGDTINRQIDNQFKTVEQKSRAVPFQVNDVMEEVLAAHGVEVRFSPDRNTYETVAYYAYQDKAAVLSGNRKMASYHGPLGEADKLKETYCSFRISPSSGELELQRQTPPRNLTNAEIPTPILRDAPRTTNSSWEVWEPLIVESREYQGGSPSPLVQFLGNPYITVRPLRKVYYAQLFSREVDGNVTIHECFPVWGNTAAVDSMEEIAVYDDQQPDEEMKDFALNDAKAAYCRLFPQEASHTMPQLPGDAITVAENWAKHVHGCKSLVVKQCCEIRALDLRRRGLDHGSISFMDMMKEAEDSW